MAVSGHDGDEVGSGVGPAVKEVGIWVGSTVVGFALGLSVGLEGNDVGV